MLNQHLAQPRYRSDFTLLAKAAGQIVGYALVAHTRWRLGKATLEAGILQALYAQPAHAAVCNELLGAYLVALADNGLPLALCDAAQARFEPLGFAPYRFTTTTHIAASAGSPEALRPAATDDLDDLAALYAESYAQLPLTELRTAPDWRAWLNQAQQVVVLEDRRQRVIAYAVVERQPSGETRVCEAAVVDAGTAHTLLAALAAQTNIVLALPLAHRLTQAALHSGGTVQISAPTGERIPLAGVVDLAGMLSALTPEFEQRLARSRYADWSGCVQIETESEQVALVVAPKQVQVTTISSNVDVRLQRVALSALAQLCLGYRAAADSRARGNLVCEDTDLGLIDTLFPIV